MPKKGNFLRNIAIFANKKKKPEGFSFVLRINMGSAAAVSQSQKQRRKAEIDQQRQRVHDGGDEGGGHDRRVKTETFG